MSPSHAIIVTHGGAGGPKSHADGCEVAARAAHTVLVEGGTALAAAVRATEVLEDDPRLNAGTGSNLRLDGVTIEMDAAVMDHRRRFGAVAALQRVRYPVRVAERVLNTPHLLLAGEGANRFARAQGFPDYDPISERARRRYQKVRDFFAGQNPHQDFVSWFDRDPAAFWNFPPEAHDALKLLAGPSDTVGAVVRDAGGGYGAALSTGGTSIMLLGRVGDTPLPGAGLYAGPAGAVATTGDGEEIMRHVLAKHIYDAMAAGTHPQAACEQGVALVTETYTVGAIAVSDAGHGVADNRTMPSAVLNVDPG